MKGYKVFNPDWTCRGFQFEVGKIFEEDITERGFRFCTKAYDCFKYYSFNPDNKIAEVEALGDIRTNNDDSKCCTNKIHIVREISWQEALELVNFGKACTGICNRNNGNRNSGDYNNGNCNSGNWNSGNRNSGDCNNGDWNSGDWNSGDWNRTCFSNGCFNTESPKIFLFNKPSHWTYYDWLDSDARCILTGCPTNNLSWISKCDMTDEEKTAHPEYKVTGGFLKHIEKETERQKWWDSLSDSQKKTVKQLPNFDKDIFKEITGISVEG